MVLVIGGWWQQPAHYTWTQNTNDTTTIFKRQTQRNSNPLKLGRNVSRNSKQIPTEKRCLFWFYWKGGLKLKIACQPGCFFPIFYFFRIPPKLLSQLLLSSHATPHSPSYSLPFISFYLYYFHLPFPSPSPLPPLPSLSFSLLLPTSCHYLCNGVFSLFFNPSTSSHLLPLHTVGWNCR